MHGRGRKLNQTKNYVAAADYVAGKRIGRKKQIWVFEEPLAVAAGEQPKGHWETVNVSK